jgi:hypothetical protein
MAELTIHLIEQAIEIPAHRWVGRCWGVAQAVAQAGLVPGYSVVYGSWLGHFRPESAWSQAGYSNVIARHGWLRNRNRHIIDPTRWAFETTHPYIYFGKNDGCYDEASQSVAEVLHQSVPSFSEDNRPFAHAFPDAAAEHVASILGPPPWDIFQMIWLGSCPISRLDPFTEDIYRTIIDAGFQAFIPIDARFMVLGEM